ncbi:hypothetical protein EVAR_17516_1 [Eumeta japonica]|uniref:Reverse transcriptase domain-containing protein n=1 Tax=Eumeta variegata TaxID=151549 RepID=A0A4C1WQ76_EUMVA|nr:hypothetical protein EVAR_17516_1 [Eumeta japonica]
MVGERDDHETEIRSVIFMNTKLKGELAEVDIRCYDLSDQRDRLQRLGNETDDCRNQYERPLPQIEALREELQNSRIRTQKLQHQLDWSGANGTIKLCDSIGSLDCTACTQETKQMTGEVRAGTPRAGRRHSPRSGRVSSPHAAPADGQNVIMYSDEFGRVAQQLKSMSDFGAWEDSPDAIGIFCDLSKAFDCVHHDTLIRKLHHYGVSRVDPFDFWSLIYVIQFKGLTLIVRGGRDLQSIWACHRVRFLDHFLFLVYINDLPHLVKNGHGIVLFADDTSLFFKID